MAAIRRFAVYLLSFIALVGVFAASGFWQKLDYAAYRSLYLDDSRQIDLHDAITPIDIPYSNDSSGAFDLADYRLRVADFLNTVARQATQSRDRPKAIILDMYIANKKPELAALEAAIKRVQAEKIKLYLVFNTDKWQQKNFDILLQENAPSIYALIDGLFLHTNFTHTNGVLSYSSELNIPREDGNTQAIEALTLRVARDLNPKIERPFDPREYVLAVGQEAEIDSQSFRFTHAADQTSNGKFSALTDKSDQPAEVNMQIDDKILLVGSFKKDRVIYSEQAGPKLVAWALDDQINFNKNARQPLNSPIRILAQLLAFGLLTALIFAALFKYIKVLQTKPLVISALSLLVSTSILGLIVMDRLSDGKVTPIALTIFAIAVSAFLAWRFAMKFLVTGVAEGSGKYDVFISYSRKESDWVVKELYEPLKALRKPDGSKLEIFFDKDEIGIGEPFTAKYMWAIVNSKVFLPVFSDGYYEKPHCRNEVDVAYKRYVSKKIVILPIAHESKAVPQIYSHMNYVSVNANPDFMDDVAKEVLASEA